MTCTRRLLFEAPACDISYKACCRWPLEGVHITHPYSRRASTTLDFTIRPSGAADVSFGNRTALGRAARSSSTLHGPARRYVQKVGGYRYGTSQIGEGGCLVVLLLHGVEDYLFCRHTGNRHAHGPRLLSEMVRLKVPKILTKTTTICSNLRSDRETMHPSLVAFRCCFRVSLQRLFLRAGKICEHFRVVAESL